MAVQHVPLKNLVNVAEVLKRRRQQHKAEQVVLMSGAQLGKTSILENFIGYVIDLDPPTQTEPPAYTTTWDPR
ncbi:MAG: phage terminase large subunit family protein [Acidobacteria bacterium]|nr:phage terminase large subunit family protein [Acidobacteriota bacterium]